MTWMIIDLWLFCLLAFAVGALVAWLVVRAKYRPIDDVRAELPTELKGVRA